MTKIREYGTFYHAPQRGANALRTDNATLIGVELTLFSYQPPGVSSSLLKVSPINILHAVFVSPIPGQLNLP